MTDETMGIVLDDGDLTEALETADAGVEAEDTGVTETVVVTSDTDYTEILNDINLKLTFAIVILILALAWFCWKKLVQYLDIFFK